MVNHPNRKRFPNNWPADWRLKKTVRSDRFGSGAEYAVFSGSTKVVYKSSRGWAYASEIVGSHGQGYAGEPSLHDALHHLAFAWATKV